MSAARSGVAQPVSVAVRATCPSRARTQQRRHRALAWLLHAPFFLMGRVLYFHHLCGTPHRLACLQSSRAAQRLTSRAAQDHVRHRPHGVPEAFGALVLCTAPGGCVGCRSSSGAPHWLAGRARWPRASAARRLIAGLAAVRGSLSRRHGRPHQGLVAVRVMKSGRCRWRRGGDPSVRP